MKKNLSLIDASFLRVETKETPMHVASLQIFKLPSKAGPEFVKTIVQSYRQAPPNSAPWNLRLKQSLLASLIPGLESDNNIDMSYHVRHTCLPKPGGERELGELISHLHGQQLDRSRPLWTCHVIEGLENNRFAVYTKIHHALTDGIRGMHMANRCLSEQPDGATTAPWHWEKVSKNQKNPKGEKPAETPKISLRQWAGHLQSAVAPNFMRKGAKVQLPFKAPKSVLNTPVTAARRVATQSLDISRVKKIGEQLDVSFNDVFLGLCSTALRRHLQSIGKLPEAPLISGVPVSLRAPGDTSEGNSVGFLWANLATDIESPIERVRAISASMQASKSHLSGLPQALRSPYTLATMSPVISVLLSGLGGKLPPPMNTTISNVPGPQNKLYLNGAELQAIFPVSIPFQGQALNITCVSYAGRLNVGFVGSRDTLPHLQYLAVYLGEALEELELLVSQQS
jgi:diacylglycerol O-acyltransferase / wax synthase